ncbi:MULTISPECIES: stage II sporulation protein M [Cytobacillus]|uniref:Stage II sporulation protein M n=1 Tax=Cytobacillus kochii TaxID=859143 RepID=A0A248TLM8_9BACI|nr:MULTISPECIES: stage II sporulation protein M [Cytobacillus]ASV69124.1 stage II sporulation protein M [Cytobacillus kochii]MEA1852966.1 stage II sporulation protein M [Cytobacillus sp. OWB-43]
MIKKMYQNVVANHFREHSSIYLFVIILFLMGVIFGAVVVNSLSLTQKEDLFQYLTQFFGHVSNEEMATPANIFEQSLLHNGKYIGVIWLLGISIIGLPLILVLLFMKGMVVGFTVGFLVSQLKWHGFLLSFVSILPQNMIIIPIFIITSTFAISFSMKMIRRLFMKKVNNPFMPLLGKYLISFLIAIIILAGASAIEAYISPVLMKSVIDSVL